MILISPALFGCLSHGTGLIAETEGLLFEIANFSIIVTNWSFGITMFRLTGEKEAFGNDNDRYKITLNCLSCQQGPAVK